MSLKLKRDLIMKSFIIFLSVFLIFTLCRMIQNPASKENIEETIISLERQALDKWSQGNPLGFAVNLADDATYFDDIGAHTRLDGAQEVKKYLESLVGKIPPHKYKLVDPKVQVYDNVAILTLRYHSMIDTVSGPPWKATSVYRLKDDKWKMVHAHWSLVKEQ